MMMHASEQMVEAIQADQVNTRKRVTDNLQQLRVY